MPRAGAENAKGQTAGESQKNQKTAGRDLEKKKSAPAGGGAIWAPIGEGRRFDKGRQTQESYRSWKNGREKHNRKGAQERGSSGLRRCDYEKKNLESM